MLTEHTNYRTFLKGVLAEKKAKNPRLSLRAFAQQIGVSASALSQVLSGKKNFSSESALRIAKVLKLNEKEIEYFVQLVQLEASKDPSFRESVLKKLSTLEPQRKIFDLNVEYFKTIADWQHLAIRNILELEGFDFTPSNVAKALGISRLEVEATIARLLELELIEELPNHPGRYRKIQSSLRIESKAKNHALQMFHRQMLEKAIVALSEQDSSQKVVGSETLAIPEGALKEAEKIIEHCFSQIAKLAETKQVKTKVYHLGIQFFNLMPHTKGN